MANIVYGALADQLHDQLRVDKGVLKTEQRIADSITLLKVQGMLTDSQTHSARKKLTSRIADKLADEGLRRKIDR